MVRGARNIEALLGMAPLSVIPLQLNTADILDNATFKKRGLQISIITVILLTLLLHFFVSPLDVIWFRLLRKLDGIAG